MSVPAMIQHGDPRLRLCVVTDDLRDGIEGLASRMQAAVGAGATMVLLRLKHADARTLVEAGRALVNGLTVPVLVRDRIDVALACGAAGVYLSEGSMPVAAVRSQVPAAFIVAASIGDPEHPSASDGADFMIAGLIDARGDDDAALARAAADVSQSTTTVLAVGSITPDRMGAVRDTGAAGVILVQLPQTADEIIAYVSALAA